MLFLLAMIQLLCLRDSDAALVVILVAMRRPISSVALT